MKSPMQSSPTSMDSGYDPAEVPAKLCLLCKLPIGTLEWREVRTLARFGQMLFEHVKCPPSGIASFFVCSNIKCAYAIDSTTLNKVQLQVLRRTAKRCPGCNTLQRFTEQTSLPNIQTKTSTTNGGSSHEKTTKKDRRSAVQEGRAADGYTRL